MGGHDLPRRQLPQPEGHILLRLAQIMEVDGLLPGHRLLHHLAPLQQGLQRLLQGLLPHTDELGRGGQQLAPGEKGVAVVQVVGQLEEQPRLQPLGVVPLHAHRQGQRVGVGKVHPQLPVHQQIGVAPDDLQGPVAVLAVEGHGQLEGHLMLPQKLQQAAHAHLLPEVLPHGQGPLAGDALDLSEPLRVLLQHRQGLLPELLHHPPGGGGADAPHRAGGQVVKDGLGACGHPPLHRLGLELLPVGGVVHPCPLD